MTMEPSTGIAGRTPSASPPGGHGGGTATKVHRSRRSVAGALAGGVVMSAMMVVQAREPAAPRDVSISGGPGKPMAGVLHPGRKQWPGVVVLVADAKGRDLAKEVASTRDPSLSFLIVQAPTTDETGVVRGVVQRAVRHLVEVEGCEARRIALFGIGPAAAGVVRAGEAEGVLVSGIHPSEFVDVPLAEWTGSRPLAVLVDGEEHDVAKWRRRAHATKVAAITVVSVSGAARDATGGVSVRWPAARTASWWREVLWESVPDGRLDAVESPGDDAAGRKIVSRVRYSRHAASAWWAMEGGAVGIPFAFEAIVAHSPKGRGTPVEIRRVTVTVTGSDGAATATVEKWKDGAWQEPGPHPLPGGVVGVGAGLVEARLPWSSLGVPKGDSVRCHIARMEADRPRATASAVESMEDAIESYP